MVMHGFMTVLIGIMMFATLGVLIAGLFGMVREGDPRRANKLMQWRVLLQGATILTGAVRGKPCSGCRLARRRRSRPRAPSETGAPAHTRARPQALPDAE